MKNANAPAYRNIAEKNGISSIDDSSSVFINICLFMSDV